MTAREDAQPYLARFGGAQTVVMPAAVAAWLFDHGGLREVKERCKGQHPELDGVLAACSVLSTDLRIARGSGTGTKPVPMPEPAPRSSERVGVPLAAERIGISERAVRKAAKDGRLTGEFVAGRWWLDSDSVRQYRENRAA